VLRRERQRAQPLAGRVSDRIGDGGGRRALRALAHTEKAFVGLIEQDDLNLRHFRESQDRIVGPRRVVTRVRSERTDSFRVQLVAWTMPPSIWLITPSGLTIPHGYADD